MDYNRVTHGVACGTSPRNPILVSQTCLATEWSEDACHASRLALIDVGVLEYSLLVHVFNGICAQVDSWLVCGRGAECQALCFFQESFELYCITRRSGGCTARKIPLFFTFLLLPSVSRHNTLQRHATFAFNFLSAVRMSCLSCEDFVKDFVRVRASCMVR